MFGGGFPNTAAGLGAPQQNNFLARQNNIPQLPLPPLGSGFETKLEKGITEGDGNEGSLRRATNAQRPPDYHQVQRGIRREPTAIDFAALYHSSDQLLNKATLPVTTLKRSLVDIGLASTKFELEQRTRSFLDQRGGGAATRSVEQAHNRAKKLLSAHGIDVERHQQSHDLIHLRTSSGYQSQAGESKTTGGFGGGPSGGGGGGGDVDVEAYLHQ